MKRGMTLVDLMVVLAMVALLAAVTVPRWAESRKRALVSESRAKLRMVATALEAYGADYSRFPYDGVNYNNSLGAGLFNYWYLPYTISTPVAYLQSHLVRDPYRRVLPPFSHPQFADIRYTSVEASWGSAWDSLQTGPPAVSVYYDDQQADYGMFRLLACGPDGVFGPFGFQSTATQPPYAYPPFSVSIPYDPTNGVFSTGDIIRSQICESGYPNMHP